MDLEFHTVDVFTDRQFGGNPLAVFPRAEGLSTEEMQRIANEFNLSETTFVLPPGDPAHTARVRIFTPQGEMPFAGHPNVGTAWVLATIGEVYDLPVPGDRLVFEEEAGVVENTLLRDGDHIVGARLASPQPLTLWPGSHDCPDVATVASACGLDTADIAVADHVPCLGSCGARFLLAEVTDRSALARAHPSPEVFRRALPPGVATGIHLYCVDDADPTCFHTRMFAPEHGVVEDPATGSANVVLAGLRLSLADRSLPAMTLHVQQGEDMGRLSLMTAVATRGEDGAIHTFIGGHCQPVMRGVLDLRG